MSTEVLTRDASSGRLHRQTLRDDGKLAAFEGCNLDDAGAAEILSPEEAARYLLAAAVQSLPAHGRFTVLHGEALEALERILGGGAIVSGADLLKKVERLAGISFHHVRLDFTPGQLETLQERAAREGKTVERIVEQMAPRIHEQFFNLVDTR